MRSCELNDTGKRNVIEILINTRKCTSLRENYVENFTGMIVSLPIPPLNISRFENYDFSPV
jgi:hypothetical protein